jgi:hypothetical protein
VHTDAEAAPRGAGVHTDAGMTEKRACAHYCRGPAQELLRSHAAGESNICESLFTQRFQLWGNPPHTRAVRARA